MYCHWLCEPTLQATPDDWSACGGRVTLLAICTNAPEFGCNARLGTGGITVNPHVLTASVPSFSRRFQRRRSLDRCLGGWRTGTAAAADAIRRVAAAMARRLPAQDRRHRRHSRLRSLDVACPH